MRHLRGTLKLKTSHLGLGAAALALLAGLIFQGVRLRDVQRGDVTSEARPIGLATLLPSALDGWTVRDEPLGPSEFMQDAVAKNLNYDDYVYRIYQRGGRSFGVYVAYWSPGRMPVQKVASHTPDRCWTENGWVCTEQRYSVRIEVGETVKRSSGESVVAETVNGETVDGETVGGETVMRSSDRVTASRFHRVTELKPAQWRKFVSPQGITQHVLYWHLIGGVPYSGGSRFNASPHPLHWWRDTVAYAIQGSQEQYFIRITSDRPFEELHDDPGFRSIVEALSRLGIGETVKGRAESPSH